MDRSTQKEKEQNKRYEWALIGVIVIPFFFSFFFIPYYVDYVLGYLIFTKFGGMRLSIIIILIFYLLLGSILKKAFPKKRNLSLEKTKKPQPKKASLNLVLLFLFSMGLAWGSAVYFNSFLTEITESKYKSIDIETID